MIISKHYVLQCWQQQYQDGEKLPGVFAWADRAEGSLEYMMNEKKKRFKNTNTRYVKVTKETVDEE